MKKAVAIFSIPVGLMVIGTWAFLLVFNQFPEIRSRSLETGYLLVAQGLTLTVLIVAGYGILTHREWVPALILVALGELIYCTIWFAGELAQAGSPAGLAFFSWVAAGSVLFVSYLLIHAGGWWSLP